jgi:uncharacterized protein
MPSLAYLHSPMPRPIPLALICLLLAPQARAQLSPALYQATAIVTGTDLRQRPLGFAETLTEVLVKVSANPSLADNPKVAALAQHADGFVSSFTYVDPEAWRLHHDDQGTYDRSYELTVHFDPTKIDATLTALGAPPWRDPRPLLTPIIIVRRNETPFLLSASTPQGTDMREAIVRLAAQYGFGVHFPTDDDLAAWGITLFGFPAPLGTPDPSQLRITGALDWDVHALGWVGTWNVRHDQMDHQWQISGVGFDQAFANMIRGTVLLFRGTGKP